MADSSELASLQAEIASVLAAALSGEARHAAALQRQDEQHIAETDRRDELHVRELGRRDEIQGRQAEMARVALDTRDIIGQAKGVIMATMTCSPDDAFVLLRQQSQHENRKLVDVAAEIAHRAASRAAGAYEAPINDEAT